MEDEDVKQTEVFPPPPPWYVLYKPISAEGSSEIPPLSPPAVVKGEYRSFGRLENSEAGIPPLKVKQLFRVGDAGFVDLIDVLIERPSHYARGVENIGTIFSNMHYLLNYLRVHQATATVEHIYLTEALDKREAIKNLRMLRTRALTFLEEHSSRLNSMAGNAI